MHICVECWELSTNSTTSSILRAYIFAHLSTTGPSLLTFVLSFRKKGSTNSEAIQKVSAADLLLAACRLIAPLLLKLYNILVSSLRFDRFPAFCAALVGGYSLLQHPLRTVITLLNQRHSVLLKSDRNCTSLSRFIAAFVASWFSLQLLNVERGSAKEQKPSKERSTIDVENKKTHLPHDLSSEELIVPGYRSPLAGKTLDLTLIVSIRALDTIIGDLWSRKASPKNSSSKWTSLYHTISHFTDAGVFAVSAGAVMWAWFYLPERLPTAYNSWIGEAAQVDNRLIRVLRNARWGDFVYGKDTGQAPILQSMCEDYNWPLSWGDPAQTIPIPCEMVHMGAGPSCHWHAVTRFTRAFKFSFAMYLPLQLLVKARHPSINGFKQALRDTIRSSAFLGAFISMFYYSVCLSRTLLGPKIFGRDKVTPIMWDSGLCVGAGCIACGWCILIEAEKRRHEVAFFVAPRAAATLLPRRYERKVCTLNLLLLL